MVFPLRPYSSSQVHYFGLVESIFTAWSNTEWLILINTQIIYIMMIKIGRVGFLSNQAIKPEYLSL